jgi:quinol monooxygenase YgiN
VARPSAFEEHLQTRHLGEAVAAAEGNIVGEIEIHPLVPVS